MTHATWQLLGVEAKSSLLAICTQLPAKRLLNGYELLLFQLDLLDCHLLPYHSCLTSVAYQMLLIA